MWGGVGRELGEIWGELGAQGLVWVRVCERTYRDDMSVRVCVREHTGMT